MDYDLWKEQNWDRAHVEVDISALSGNSLDGHLAGLAAQKWFTPDADVLCIGVGTGGWVTEATERTSGKVWALDVTAKASLHIPESVPLSVDQSQLPIKAFDLAMSLQVAIHMNNMDLQDQLIGVIRSLKPNGVLAIHYKEPLDDNQLVDNREGAADEWQVTRAANVLRRRKYFDRMVDRAGGVVFARPIQNPSPFFKVIDVMAHIRRKVQ